MSTKQYIRKASLIIGGDDGQALDLSDLRFRFAIRRGDTQTPNSADIRVYNVSDDTANRIRQLLPQPEFTRVVIQGGYDGNYGILFDGQIKQIRRGRESQTDTFIDITAADGDRAYNYAITAITLEANQTGAKDQIAAVLGSMAKKGVGTGYLPEIAGNPLPRGKVFYGMSRDALRQLAKNTSTNWSIQDGKVNFTPKSAYIPGEIPVVTSATGMIGLPTQTQNGIHVRALLNPNFKIGQVIKLDNASIQGFRFGLGIQNGPGNEWTKLIAKTNNDGLYYVMIADHFGDTRGQEWYSDLLCLAVDASMSPEYLKHKSFVNPSTGAVREFG